MYDENDFNFFSIWFLQKLKIKIAAIDYLYRMSRVPPGVPPPHDGSHKSAVHIKGVPPPNDGSRKHAVHINRRSKLTVIPPKDDSVGIGRGSSASAGASGTASAVSGAVMTYISSLSPLEQHVCRIAESHLESSFDILRSTGYIAWKAKNA